jgi:Tfp pilus assembly protein FimT
MILPRSSFSTARSSGNNRRRPRTGVSMLEMLLVMIVMGLLVAISVPKMGRIMRHERVNRAAQIVVADLQNGFAMAGRQRAPVRLTFTAATKTYVFSDRATGTVFQTRIMDNRSEYALTTLSASPSAVDVLPNGIGSRTVTASSAGFVRLVPL